jgi:GntR family transcriptional regulator
MDKLEAGTAAPEVSLYRRIADELRRQIRAGELRAGDPLPSEHTLRAGYLVSRGTVRQALQALRADGTIGGPRGRPPRVSGLPLTQPLDQLISFSAWIDSLGKRASGRVDAFTRRGATLAESGPLALPVGAPVYHLVRVRFADDEPLLIERTTFPAAIGALLEGVDLTSHSIYAELAGRGIVIGGARQLIGAVAASKEDARLLGVRPGIALLRARRHAFTVSGAPLEIADDRYLAHRVNFALEHNAATAGVARRLD